jgi:hypothetical protein
MSIAQRNGVRIVAVLPSLHDVLRQQTFAILEFTHEPFEDFRLLKPAERHATATVFRDAFAVLDAIGWTPQPCAGTVDVPFTPGHLAQLRRLRDDLTTAITDRLAPGDEPTDPTARRALTRASIDDRRAAQGLEEVLEACERH